MVSTELLGRENLLSVRSRSCAAVVNICGGRRGIGGGRDGSFACRGTGSSPDAAPIPAGGGRGAAADGSWRVRCSIGYEGVVIICTELVTKERKAGGTIRERRPTKT